MKYILALLLSCVIAQGAAIPVNTLPTAAAVDTNAHYLILDQMGFTKKITPGTLVNSSVSSNYPTAFGLAITNMVVVVSNGNDSTGLRGRPDRPFATIAAARDAATNGDLILVRPGTYNSTNILKSNIRIHGEAGAVIEVTNTNAKIISDTNAVITNAYVTGAFKFVYKQWESPAVNHAPIEMLRTNSEFRIECDSIYVTTNTPHSDAGLSAVRGVRGRFWFSANEIKMEVPLSYCTYWEQGDYFFNVSRLENIVAGGHGIGWDLGSNSTDNFYFTCDEIKSYRDAVSGFGPAVGSTTRIWGNVKQIIITSTDSSPGIQIADSLCYLQVEKIKYSGTASAVRVDAGATLYLTTQKISANQALSGLLYNTGGTLWVDVMELADDGNLPSYITIEGGTNDISFRKATSVATNGAADLTGINMSGGIAIIRNGFIDFSSDTNASCFPILIDGTNLTLHNVRVKTASGSAESIVTGTSAQIKVEGTLTVDLPWSSGVTFAGGSVINTTSNTVYFAQALTSLRITNNPGSGVIVARGSDGSLYVTNITGGVGNGTNIFVNGTLIQPARLTNTASVTWTTNANGDIVATATNTIAFDTTQFGTSGTTTNIKDGATVTNLVTTKLTTQTDGSTGRILLSLNPANLSLRQPTAINTNIGWNILLGSDDGTEPFVTNMLAIFTHSYVAGHPNNIGILIGTNGTIAPNTNTGTLGTFARPYGGAAFTNLGGSGNYLALSNQILVLTNASGSGTVEWTNSANNFFRPTNTSQFYINTNGDIGIGMTNIFTPNFDIGVTRVLDRDLNHSGQFFVNYGMVDTWNATNINAEYNHGTEYWVAGYTNTVNQVQVYKDTRGTTNLTDDINRQHQWVAGNTDGLTYYKIIFSTNGVGGNRDLLSFEPGTAGGTNTIAYFFDTINNINDNSALIFAVAEQGTNKMWLDGSGYLSVSNGLINALVTNTSTTGRAALTVGSVASTNNLITAGMLGTNNFVVLSNGTVSIGTNLPLSTNVAFEVWQGGKPALFVSNAIVTVSALRVEKTNNTIFALWDMANNRTYFNPDYSSIQSGVAFGYTTNVAPRAAVAISNNYAPLVSFSLEKEGGDTNDQMRVQYGGTNKVIIGAAGAFYNLLISTTTNIDARGGHEFVLTNSVNNAVLYLTNLFTITNMSQTFSVTVSNAGTHAYTFTNLEIGIAWPSSTHPVPSHNKTDVWTFKRVGAVLHGSVVTNFNNGPF